MPRVLVVGSGGREHAICAKLAQDGCEVICAPGSDGIRDTAEILPDVSVKDILKLAEVATKRKVDLTFVGPEAPIVAGIGDEFRRDGQRIVCPSKAAARLEGSKVFAKVFMRGHKIPTARFAVALNPSEARDHIVAGGLPIVLKADGLAAGKGVFVCRTMEEARTGLNDLMIARKFGSAADRIVIEECLVGRECSFIILTDGAHIMPLPVSQDYKRLFAKDEGPNTGGMGAVSPVEWLTAEMQERIMREIVRPTIDGMFAEGMPYLGVLYFGLMITEDGPMLLEYNVRLGDPETEVVLPRIESSFYEMLEATLTDTLDQIMPKFSDKKAACVVLASKGYGQINDFQTGFPISGLEDARNHAAVYHAGTKLDGNGRFVTAGGRVIVVSSLTDTWQMTLDKAQRAAQLVRFQGKHRRLDI